MSVPHVILSGPWPAAAPGESCFPRVVARAPVTKLSLEAFAYYGYLVSLGYSQDGLSPLPEAVAATRRGLTAQAARRAFCELASVGLITIASAEQDGPITEVTLPLPSEDWA